MRIRSILVLTLCILPLTGWAMGRKSGDGYEIEPVKRGSAANPNPAYSAPTWGDDYRPSASRTPSKTSKAKKGAIANTPDEPDVPKSTDPFPDYAAPQLGATPPSQPMKATPIDSLEPPLPDEPGGDPDQRPSK